MTEEEEMARKFTERMGDEHIAHVLKNRAYYQHRYGDNISEQCIRVYTAEEKVDVYSRFRIESWPLFLNYVRFILQHPVVRQYIGHRSIDILPGDGMNNAFGGSHTLIFPRTHRTRWLVMHEVAHLIHGPVLTKHTQHGRHWCELYLSLTRMFLGELCAVELESMLKIYGAYSRENSPLSPIISTREAESLHKKNVEQHQISLAASNS